jgi:hypothetical protein
MYRKLFSKIEPLLTEKFSPNDKKIWFDKNLVTQMAILRPEHFHSNYFNKLSIISLTADFGIISFFDRQSLVKNHRRVVIQKCP